MALADEARAAQMKAYLKGQFSCFGVMATPRRNCFKETIKELGVPDRANELAIKLFDLPQREFHMCGQELLLRAKRQWHEKSMDDFEYFITTNCWWDSVDYLASNVIGEYCMRYDPKHWRSHIEKWARSDHMWLQRTAIIFQLKYKTKTDTDWLATVIDMHAHQKEFFIKKAIGWALREYSKFNRTWVEEFVASRELQPLSKKEALRL